MRETRRLDILALIGGVLALVAIAVQGYYTIRARTYSFVARAAETREAILQRMLDTDVRADFEALTAMWDKKYVKRMEALYREYEKKPGEGYRLDREQLQIGRTGILLERAIRKFPNSARLHFRLAMFTTGPSSIEAIRKVSELDPGNALPCYLLASDAASRKAWDEALRFLMQGNNRKRLTEYPLPRRDVDRHGVAGLILLPGATGDYKFSVISRLRRLATSMSGHASEIHADGRTGEALGMLDSVKQMGWKFMRGEDAMTLDVVVGSAFVAIFNKREAQIYTETGSKAGLAQVQKEKRKLAYLRAGRRAYWDQLMEGLVRSGARFSAPIASVAPIIGQSWLTVAMLLLWAAFALRTRRVPTSELHLEAAAKSFSVGRLLKYYAPIFLLPGLAASVLTYLAFSEYTLVRAAAGAAFLVPSVFLLWLSARLYRKTYLQTAESLGREKPRFWAGAPAQDKREIARRLAGVHGGAMIFLLVWGLLVSGVVKLTWDAFPWQIERAFAGVYKTELRYTADLVAGKVKVPQKYIREIEERERQPAKPGGS